MQAHSALSLAALLAATVAGTAALPAQMVPTSPPPAEQAPGGWKVDLRAGAWNTPATFELVGDGATDEKESISESLTGLELSLGPRGGGIGLVGRYQQARLPLGTYFVRDAGLYLGGRAFRIEGAYAQRQLAGADTTAAMLRAGLRSVIPIGYGISLTVAGSGFGHIDRADDEELLNAWEGEGHVTYVIPRLPIYVQGGYRMGRFKTGAPGSEVETEFRGISIGAGVWTNPVR